MIDEKQPLHIEHLQAVAPSVGIVPGDVVEFRQLRPAVCIAVNLAGKQAQLPVGAFDHIAVTPLALPLHGYVTVLPLTTKSQWDDRMAYPIELPDMQRS